MPVRPTDNARLATLYARWHWPRAQHGVRAMPLVAEPFPPRLRIAGSRCRVHLTRWYNAPAVSV